MKTELKIKNDLAEIERLAGMVRSFGREHGLADVFVWEIRLVLEEFVTNIISYGYEDDRHHTIAVSIANEKEDIVLTVRDDARPFNLLEHPVPDMEIPLAERKIGGMGIHLVREIMDEIDYSREGNENLVVMRRQKEGRK